MHAGYMRVLGKCGPSTCPCRPVSVHPSSSVQQKINGGEIVIDSAADYITHLVLCSYSNELREWW